MSSCSNTHVRTSTTKHTSSFKEIMFVVGVGTQKCMMSDLICQRYCRAYRHTAAFRFVVFALTPKIAVGQAGSSMMSTIWPQIIEVLKI